MNIALWLAAGALALIIGAAGYMKAFVSIEELRKMPWAAKFPAHIVRAIGVSELLGAIGLVLPQATNIAEILTPLAAAGLAVLMLGATVTHIRIKDAASASITTLVLLGIAVFVAIGRFAGVA